MFKKLCDLMTVQIMYSMSIDIINHEGNKSLLASSLIKIYLLELLSLIANSYGALIGSEVNQATRVLVNTLIYRKVLKFRLMYNKDYNEGRLVGFM